MVINRQERIRARQVINHQDTLVTKSRNNKMIRENDLVLNPGSEMPSVALRNKFHKICVSLGLPCFRNLLDTTVTIETKAHTPFFLSGPWFSFGVFRRLTMADESFFDVMIKATRSEERSVTGTNCLQYYNIHESIFKRSDLFSKSVTAFSRKDSILVNLVQLERKRSVQIRIKVLTRSELSKIKPATTIDLEWTSVVSMSGDISRKTISLPGILRSVTLERLGFVKNSAINIHWIPDMFSRNFYQSNQSFCHKKLLTKTKYTYCLNYTSVQNSYIFLWNFTQYLKCYYRPNYKYPQFILMLGALGFNILKDNNCPRQQSKGKVIKSWTEAYNLCKSIGGTLPLLRNRGELEEIIAFLKLSKDMPPVEGLYIGIQGSFRSQVMHRIN